MLWAVALLKKYIDRYYKYRKQGWEADHLEYHDLDENDPNFVTEYRLLVEQSQVAIVENLGRLKEMILRGGENVSPAEVEEILLGHPAVADAACFGIPDDKYGEEVAVAVSLNREATARELIDYCRERLTTFKVPKQIYLVEAVPRTATGKLQRRRIAAQLTEPMT